MWGGRRETLRTIQNFYLFTSWTSLRSLHSWRIISFTWTPRDFGSRLEPYTKTIWVLGWYLQLPRLISRFSGFWLLEWLKNEPTESTLRQFWSFQPQDHLIQFRKVHFKGLFNACTFLHLKIGKLRNASRGALLISILVDSFLIALPSFLMFLWKIYV